MNAANPAKKNKVSRLLSQVKQRLSQAGDGQAKLVEQSHQASVRFESLEPRVLLAGDTGIVSVVGSIAVQGERDQYEFSLDSTHRVVFDSLTNRTDITWRLENEQGIVVDHSLQETERYTPLAELAAGHYTLTVDGVGDARGDYQLRLIDVNAAEDLVMGQAISGQLTTGKETQVYRFNAQAGDSFYLQSLLSTSQVSWRLIDPSNQIEISTHGLSGDTDTTRLQKTGQYLLLVEGNLSNTQATDFSFIWHKVEHLQQTLSLDQLSVATINSIGQKAIFDFSITEPTQVLLNALTQSPFTWQLTGSQGTVITERTYQAMGKMAYPYALLSLLAGDYQLTIDLPNTATASIPFRLLSTTATNVLTPNHAYQQQFGAFESQLLTLNLEQGEKIRVDVSDGLTWQLIDRFGLVVTSNANAAQVIEVTDSGTYYLRLDTAQAGEYQVKVTDIPELEQNISANSVISGQISQVEQISHYDFSLAQASSLSLSVEQGLTGLMYRLIGPRGEEKAWQSVNNLNLAYLPQGQYRLSLKSTQEIGDYNIQLNTAAMVTQPVTIVGDALNLNQSVAGVLPEAEPTQSYHFNLTEDSLLWMDILAASSVTWSLLGPKGVEVNERSFYSSDAPNARSTLLLLAGDYVLTVHGYAGEAYSFRLLTAANTPHLTFNQSTLVDISPATSSVIYQFEAQANQDFVLVHSYNSSQRWSVYDAYGQQITLDYHDAGYTFTTQQAGQYYVAVEGAYYQTGTSQAQFTLYQPQITTTTLPFNDLLTRQLAKRFDQINYQFSVDQPEVFVLDGLFNSNSASVEWQLTGPQGQVFSWQSLTTSQGARLLTAGKYTLSLRNTSEQAATYQVAVLNRQAAPPLAFAQPQQADLSQGKQVLYRFSAQAGESLYLQGDWNNSWNSRWTLFNAYGQEVLQDYTRGDKPHVSLTTTGEYLLVLASGSSQDQVNFTAWPRTTTNQSLSFNTPIQASLTEPAQRQRYQFTLDDESTIYIAPNSTAQTQSWSWRLLNSQGQTIRQQDFKNGEFNHLAAGSYSLEFSAYDLSTGDFSFQVFDGLQVPQMGFQQAQDIVLNAQQQQQVYRLKVTNPEKFLMNSHELPANSMWQLVNARGQSIGSGYAGDFWAEPLSLTTGDYYVLVKYQGLTERVTGQISIHAVNTITHPTQLDTQWAGSISQFAQRHAYTFEISQATTVLLDYLNQGGDFIWQLSGPDGQLYDYVGLADSQFQLQPFVLTKAGQYTLTVRSKNAALGDFKFSLRDLSGAASLPEGQQTLTFDAAQSQLWTVNAQAGQTLLWRMSSPPSEPFYLAVFNAQGQLVTGSLLPINDARLEQHVVLAQTGQYYLQFVPAYSTSLMGDLTVDVNIQLLGQQSQAANLEQVMEGQSRATNFAESWTFSLNQPSRLLFDGLSGLEHQVILYRDNGQQLYQGFLQDSALWQLAAGKYRIELIATSSQVLGAYQFQLHNVDNAPLLALAQPITLSATGQQAHIYRVHSPIDEQLLLQLQASEQALGTVSIFDASGYSLEQGYLQDVE